MNVIQGLFGQPRERDGRAVGYRDFGELYRAHAEAVYRLAFRQLGTREEAEDVTAAVFEEALRHVQLQRQPAEIAVWLRQVTRGILARHWREHYRLPLVPLGLLDTDDGEAGMAAAEGEDLRTHVLAILARLPENYREVLRLRFLEGCSLRETAERLGTTEGNVKVLQHRALRKALESAEK